MDQEKLLEEMRPWLIKQAKKYKTATLTFEDLLQEGWIAGWKAATQNPDHPNLQALARASAKNRFIDLVRGRGTFGSERPQGTNGVVKQSDTLIYDHTDSQDEMYAELIETAKQVKLAYHYGEIHDAISELNDLQKKYVYMRFWHDIRPTEISREINVPPPKLDKTWKSAKDSLRETLHHLRDAS